MFARASKRSLVPVVILSAGLLGLACSATSAPDPARSSDSLVGGSSGGSSGSGGGDGDGAPCGETTCGAGLVCCNSSCGICAAPGAACINLYCEATDASARDDGNAPTPEASAPDAAAGEPCGETTCGAGLVCCNSSCGMCTEPGGACIQVYCEKQADEGGARP